MPRETSKIGMRCNREGLVFVRLHVCETFDLRQLSHHLARGQPTLAAVTNIVMRDVKAMDALTRQGAGANDETDARFHVVLPWNGDGDEQAYALACAA